MGLHSTQGLANWKASHPQPGQDWAGAETPRGNRTREVSQPLPIVLEPCQAGAERGPVLGGGPQARRSVFFLSSQPARNTAVTKEPSLGAEPPLSLFPVRLCTSVVSYFSVLGSGFLWQFCSHLCGGLCPHRAPKPQPSRVTAEGPWASGQLRPAVLPTAKLRSSSQQPGGPSMSLPVTQPDLPSGASGKDCCPAGSPCMPGLSRFPSSQLANLEPFPAHLCLVVSCHTQPVTSTC